MLGFTIEIPNLQLTQKSGALRCHLSTLRLFNFFWFVFLVEVKKQVQHQFLK
jgi:hypothetical protein